MKSISMQLNFAGIILPTATNEQGQQVVPLKPISDIIGIQWERQRTKVQTPYFARRLGTCTIQMYGAGQQREMVSIRLDRVSAYLNTISPDQVRGAGNDAAADFLEKKHEEWDNLIHEYEMTLGTFEREERVKASAKIINIRTFLAVSKEKRCTAHAADRKTLDALSANLASDLGLPYQQDLVGAG